VPGPQLGERVVQELPDARVEAVFGEQVAQDVVVQPPIRFAAEGEVALASRTREQLDALGLPAERDLPFGPVVQRRRDQPLQNPAVDVVAAEFDGLLGEHLRPAGLAERSRRRAVQPPIVQ